MLLIILKSGVYNFYIVVAIVLLIVVISYYFSKEKTILRALSKIKVTEISKCRQNDYVKLKGKAVSGKEPLLSPFSKRPCVSYFVQVQRRNKNGWYTIIKEERFQDFFLEQNNGERAMIKPGNIHYNFKKSFFEIDHENQSGFGNDAKPHLEAF